MYRSDQLRMLGVDGFEVVGMSNSISMRSPFFHVRLNARELAGRGARGCRLPFTAMLLFGPAHAGMRTKTANAAALSVATSIWVVGRCGYSVRWVRTTRRRRGSMSRAMAYRD